MTTERPPQRKGVGRRRFITGSAAGAAVAWSVPNLITVQAAAAGTNATPQYVAGATGFHQTGSVLQYKRSVTLTTTGVQAGDLWLAVIGYDARSGATVTTPSGMTLITTTSRDSGTSVWPANNSVYSVKGYVYGRVLLASDITGGSFSRTFATPGNQAIDYGGLRGAAVVYRAPISGALTLPSVTAGNGFGPVASGDIVTTTFPAISPIDPNSNQIVRIGIARGYGGWYGLDSPMYWDSGPGTTRVNYYTGNFGDRAIWISEQANNAGGTASGTWYKQINGNPPNTENWVAFTVSIEG